MYLSRPALGRESVNQLTRWRSTHRFKTNKLQTRDQLVCPFKKSCPDSTDIMSAEALLERRRDVLEFGAHLLPKRASEPMFPRKREGSLGLRDDFLGQKVGQGVDKQRFGPAVSALDRSRQSGHELDQSMVKKRYPHLKGVGHTHGIRVAQQRIDHVGPGFQTGHGGEIIKLLRSLRGLIEPIPPRFRRA